MRASDKFRQKSAAAPRRVSRTAAHLLAVLLATASTGALAECETVKPTDPVSGTLHKVTTRDNKGKLVTNWQIVPSTPVCITLGEVDWKDEHALDVEFAKGVDLKSVDEALGQEFGVKGKIVGLRDERDTANLIVTNAEIYTDLNEAGEVRKR